MYHGHALNRNKTQGLIITKKANRQKWQCRSINFDGKNVTFTNEREVLGAIITPDPSQDAICRKICTQMH